MVGCIEWMEQKQGNHTYRPVTIKQLLDAYQATTDSEFRIDDVELDHVRRSARPWICCSFGLATRWSSKRATRSFDAENWFCSGWFKL